MDNITMYQNSIKLHNEINFCIAEAKKANQNVIWSKCNQSVSWCQNVRDDDIILWDAKDIDPMGIYSNNPDIMTMVATIAQFDPDGFNSYLNK